MYFKLVKVFFKENFSLKRLFGFSLKQSKLKAIGIGFLILYALVALMGSFGFMFFDLSSQLKAGNQLELVMAFAVTYTIGLSIMMSLLRSSGYLFHYKDYDILAPLPIKDSTVVYAKITVMLMMLYITSSIFIAPIAFGYFFHQGVSFFGLFYFLIGFLVTPFIPVVLTSFLSLLLFEVTKRLPFSKLFNIVFLFALFIGIFFVSFSFSAVEVNPLTGQIDMIKGFAEIYPMIRFFLDAVHKADHLAFLAYVLVSIGIMALYIYLMKPLLKKTNQSKQVQYFSKNKKTNYQSNSVMWSLVLKEVKRYFSIPIYVLNTGLGVIIIMGVSIASLFFKTDIQIFLSELSTVNLSLMPLLIIVFGFSIVMTYTTAVSLSLEGKHFWIIKSLPLEPATVMLSKILFNMLLVLPASFIGSILLMIALSLSFIEWLIFIFVITSLTILSSLLGSFINLYMPKFEFSSEVEVIKQSVASFVAIFGGYAILITFGFMYYYLTKITSSDTALVLIGLTMTILSGLLFRLLIPVSRKQFLKY